MPVKLKLLTPILLIISAHLLQACTSLPPQNADDICETFREKGDWYTDAKNSFKKWGVPISVQMAIIHQESRFVADAEPPRPWLLGIIPWFRSSTAYGYAQAQDDTWDDYIKQTDAWNVDRDDFADATDFVGWYNHISYTRLGISKWDTRRLYLAYHEGHGGYQRKTYLNKTWLLRVAEKVDRRARLYRSQLDHCKKELESKSYFFW